MSDRTLDANFGASEDLFAALYRANRGGLRRAVLRMRELHAGGLPWEQIRCELDPKRFSTPAEAQLVNAVGECLREYALSDRPV